MVTVTVSVPEELKKKMDSFSEINWSEVARRAFAQKTKDLDDLAALKRFSAESEFTEEDTIELGRKVNASMAKRYREFAEKVKKMEEFEKSEQVRAKKKGAAPSPNLV